MDERIMKVLEAAGARIADLEADLAEMKDANDYVCGQRDALESTLEQVRAELSKAKEDAENSAKELVEKGRSVLYWYTEYSRLEAENNALVNRIDALNEERATVEAVD